MRFNKTILVLLLGAVLTLSLVFQPALAKNGASIEAVNHCEKKNEGRRLSMTLPGFGTASVTVTPTKVKPITLGKPLAPGRHIMLGQPEGGRRLGHKATEAGDSKDLSIETNGNNITVRVPASLDAAIDDAEVVSRQLGKCASKGLAGVNRFVDLIVLYFKQWSGTTTITPGGFPYVEKSSSYMHTFGQAPTTIASGHKLFFTGEGRLKSVEAR